MSGLTSKLGYLPHVLFREVCRCLKCGRGPPCSGRSERCSSTSVWAFKGIRRCRFELSYLRREGRYGVGAEGGPHDKVER